MADARRNDVRVQAGKLDVEAELATLFGADVATGAVVSFVGLMRDFNQGDRVAAMTLEHYPGMTDKALQAIVDEAHSRWSLHAVRVIHRVGDLHPADPIVLVAVASAHRGDAFRACEFLIDYLKTRAPFWKRETTIDGDSRWVESRTSDAQAAQRWQKTDAS